ncbi:MAG TPA: M1 family metallopeptidase [Chitinophagaceae bacterium]|nr:M1 family metallopeptidase [Chitinophagaceae bacterium]
MKKFWLFCFLSSCILTHAQRDNSFPVIDVLHYTFNLQLNDENNNIKGEAIISIKFLQTIPSFDLDMVKKNSSGRGMIVTGVKENNSPVSFLQEVETIHIYSTAKAGDTVIYTISYAGIPADGLIIDKNKYGHRTFFGDNWPNRAHNWLPCIDNPSDKASVDFIVTAPEHYQVVSNGLQVEENNLPNHFKLTHWRETVDLPVKVMAIGAADFAVNRAGDVDGIPVYSWVYPEDKDQGFHDYAMAKDILPFFIKNLGPYAYRKLANVQSKTQFGGMENASAIFYYENSVGDRKLEALLAHEIAHQWFGNSATETSWPHLWLSEGFATYMTHLYLENKYGADTLQKRLQQDRDTVIAFSKKKYTPVVDSSVASNFFQLLNANSYKKGGWILHMLRRKLGNAIFWLGIKNYYAQYAGKNASTDDFRKIMEAVSGQDLQSFFQQWLFTAGHPVLKISWKYDKAKKSVFITIEQTQPVVFQFPLQMAIQSASGEMLQTFLVKEKMTTIDIPLATKPLKILPDPNINLLFEGTVGEVKYPGNQIFTNDN